jgi:NAD(P)-dependent dehydrogenase (short-subunit alcohol dehydrogenase family)
MSFKNAVALVAGGASGLGLATAQRIVARGGHAVIMDLERSNGREEAAKHANLKFVAGDITSCNDVAGAVEYTKASFNNRVDLAVQCAGIGTAFMTVSPKMSPEKRTALFKKTIDVNLVGAFNFVTHVAEVMSTQDPRPVNPDDETIDHDSRGVILMTASIAAMDGQRGQSGYGGSKAGIVGMTLPIARDLAKYQIRVNTICPGLFDTPLLAALPEKARIALGNSVPHPSRLGHPSEYAALVEHMFHNPMFNAETLRLDGALRMNM